MFNASPGRLPTVMGHQFSEVPHAEIPRSQFNRSHGYKTTFNSGYLVPVYCDEALPGDTFNLKMTTFARMNTPLVPIMDNLYCDTFFFAVPLRLIWDNFKKMMGEQANPDDTTDYMVPIMTSTASTGYTEGSLHDYFGLPTKIPGYTHTSTFHRAYNLIWNEWFRDQNLQDSVVVDKDDGPDSPADYVLLKRGKRHDYFTSALPWPQKSEDGVSTDDVRIPLGNDSFLDQVSVKRYSAAANALIGYDVGTNSVPATSTYLKTVTSTGHIKFETSGLEMNLDPNGTLYADLSEATQATINNLRTAFQIQKLLERDARGGTRYVEIIRSHFGVVSPDFRLQRPEYLGGGSTPIQITPVPQTSATDTTSPQGNLAGFGTFSHRNNGFVKSFTEHCVLIGLVNVRADLNYQQGIERMFDRRTKLDFYWPALANISEQPVLNKEIYLHGDSHDDEVFGYQERYAEYRYKPSKVTGLFRSNATGSLDIWHLAQDFASLPVLDSDFIKEAPPVSRVVAVENQPEFMLDCYFNLVCARPMPTYSVPGLVDHF